MQNDDLKIEDYLHDIALLLQHQTMVLAHIYDLLNAQVIMQDETVAEFLRQLHMQQDTTYPPAGDTDDEQATPE